MIAMTAKRTDSRVKPPRAPCAAEDTPKLVTVSSKDMRPTGADEVRSKNRPEKNPMNTALCGSKVSESTMASASMKLTVPPAMLICGARAICRRTATTARAR